MVELRFARGAYRGLQTKGYGLALSDINRAASLRAVGEVDRLGTGFWWVNNKQTHEHEVGKNFLWSPTKKKDGGHNEFYDNMLRVRPGDVVFAFAGGEIGAVGICSAPAFLAPKPVQFGAAGNARDNEGWRLPVKSTRLSAPLCPQDHMDVLAPTLPKVYSPRPLGE